MAPDNNNPKSIRSGNHIVTFVMVGIFIVALILVIGTIWTGRTASKDTEEAVSSVSLFYLEELAGKRQEVVSSNLRNSIRTISAAVELIDEKNLQDMTHLQVFQNQIKKLFNLEKFAFVDSNGIIYTSQGTQTNIKQYPFDYKTITGPTIGVKDIHSENKRIIIAVPVSGITFGTKQFVVCFMEISMESLLNGITITQENNGTTFFNIYSADGIALTNMVLGGLASEGNLLDAMEHAQMDEGYTLEKMKADFISGNKGAVSFTYNGIKETLYYVPIEDTELMLTYLIRESLINAQFSSISRGIIVRSLVLSVFTALILSGIFVLLFRELRRSSRLELEKETAETENRIKQEELEHRLELQEQLLEQEKQQAQQDSMITALASDYRTVYYVNLDTDEAICYRGNSKGGTNFKAGDHFPFHETFVHYADTVVDGNDRERFLKFIEPDTIRERLQTETILSCRYLARQDGRETYEMLRIAGVRHAEDRTDHIVHAVGLGFTDVDEETRDTIAKNRALSDALTAAEEASKAKTVFLSNMSHEIRTPMNAIIGLDNIALNDPDISEKTRDHLEKIGASAQHLLTIINDILDMSRIESGRMTLRSEEFSFPKLLSQINTIISGQCQDKGLEYDCQIKGQIDDYYIGDDTKLRQVIINILGNSVKFTPEGGKVSFTIERTAHYDGKSTLRLTMADTGIGMDKSFLPKLFETFSQEDSTAANKYGSTGLGLAITKIIVEMMNGDIHAESEKGVGTTFTVTITLMDSERSHDEKEETELLPQELSVLVIDDDPIACEHNRLMLSKAGITCESVTSGTEAVEIVKLRHARRNPFNLILVDWKMPELDGVETTRRIRQIIGNESAIIILTAYKWDDIYDEAIAAGVDGFIAKPLFASNIMDEFQTILHRKDILTTGKIHRADLTGRRILLAEDVVINAEIMIMLLATREMKVEHAENGKIAVDMFSSHPAHYYDAVLMDMRMPEMDGLAATSAIRALDREDAKQIPIIALTANAFDEDVQRSLQAGLNAHLSKPVDPDNLFETLELLIKD